MRRNRTGSRLRAAVLLAIVLGGAGQTNATIIGPPPWCAADCNGDGEVSINEIITCVNVALGSTPPENCPACDSDGDGLVGINDLVQAVRLALFPDCFGLPDRCGNGAVDDGESCDDGNDLGGDGCAANCTVETVRTASVELSPLSELPERLYGTVVLRTGQPRADAAGSVGPGDLPVALRADDLRFEPARVTGLACVCARALPLPARGQVAGIGTIHCGIDGGADLDYRIVQDHNTTPGDPGNREAGTPDDAECDDNTPGPVGTTSRACREGDPTSCPGWEDPVAHPHTGVCNGPRLLTLFGGAAPRGSALFATHLATTLLRDAGACTTSQPMREGACQYPDYGADCLPCTDDDTPSQTWSEILLLTTGSADAAVFDRATQAPAAAAATSTSIVGCFPLPCPLESTAPFDCDALAATPDGGLGGAALAYALPMLDRGVRDVAHGVLAFSPAAATPGRRASTSTSP